MSDKANDKSNTPILIIIVCASITMLVQTFSAAITVMGYDEVIRADAKARATKILQDSKPANSSDCIVRLEQIEAQVKHNTELAHEGNK